MENIKKCIHDDSNGLDYVLVGDYYITALKMPEESRSIGRLGPDAPGLYQTSEYSLGEQ